MPHQNDGAPEIYSEYTESDIQGGQHEYHCNILSRPNACTSYFHTGPNV